MSVTRKTGTGLGAVMDGSDAIERARLLLSGIPGGAEKAVKAAVSRAASNLKANSSREVRKEYAISHKGLSTDKNVRITAYGGGLGADVVFRGMKIPLAKFSISPKVPTLDKTKLISALINGAWKKVHPGKSVKASIKIGAPGVTSKRAFVARMSSGHLGIFDRKDRKSAAITERFGPSIPEMLSNEDVRNHLVIEARSVFENRDEHEITRILTTQGGRSL